MLSEQSLSLGEDLEDREPGMDLNWAWRSSCLIILKTLQEDKRTEDGRIVDTRIMKRDGLVDSGLWTEEEGLDTRLWTEGVDSKPWTEGVATLVPSAPSRDLLSDDSDVS